MQLFVHSLNWIPFKILEQKKLKRQPGGVKDVTFDLEQALSSLLLQKFNTYQTTFTVGILFSLTSFEK